MFPSGFSLSKHPHCWPSAFFKRRDGGQLTQDRLEGGTLDLAKKLTPQAVLYVKCYAWDFAMGKSNSCTVRCPPHLLSDKIQGFSAKMTSSLIPTPLRHPSALMLLRQATACIKCTVWVFATGDSSGADACMTHCLSARCLQRQKARWSAVLLLSCDAQLYAALQCFEHMPGF